MPDDNDTNDDGLSQEELEQQAQQAVEDGRAMQKITQLLQDNYEQREQLRQLRDKTPGDDQVVLDPEEAEQLQEVGALDEEGNPQPETVQERIESGQEAQEELQRLRQKEKRREVYEATGLNAEAAEDILPDDVTYEVETEDTEDGEETRAYVETDDGRQPVEEYVEENFSEPIQDALYASGDEEAEGGEEGSGKSVPQQTPAGEDNPGDDEPDEEEIRQQKRQQINYGV